MIIGRGRKYIYFGPGQLVDASIINRDNHYSHYLLLITMKEMQEKMKVKATGTPVYIALLKFGKAVIWPVPDRKCELRIRYMTLHEA